MVEEVYKVVGDIRFPNCYEISNKGNIRSLRKDKKQLKLILNNYGYYYITGNYRGYRSTLSIARLVAKAFIPNPDNKPEVNHKDGIKTNNNDWNLEWCTDSEQMKHAVKMGLSTNASKKGEEHNTSKHTFATVQVIREKYKTGKYSMRGLAKQYNTTSGYISDVINNKIRIDC